MVQAFGEEFFNFSVMVINVIMGHLYEGVKIIMIMVTFLCNLGYWDAIYTPIVKKQEVEGNEVKSLLVSLSFIFRFGYCSCGIQFHMPNT